MKFAKWFIENSDTKNRVEITLEKWLENPRYILQPLKKLQLYLRKLVFKKKIDTFEYMVNLEIIFKGECGDRIGLIVKLRNLGKNSV